MTQAMKSAPVKHCNHCQSVLHRKRFNKTLEDYGRFVKRKYCNRACMAAAMEGVIKNPTPHNGRRQAMKMVKDACEMCGRMKTTTRLYVHHKDGNPLNNKPENLQTLCGSCHSRMHSPNYQATLGRKRQCSHCSKPVVRNDLCGTHLTRFKRYGNPLLKKFKIGSEWVLRVDNG